MSADQFLQVADLLPEAMLLATVDGTILAANRAFQERFPRPSDELSGQRLGEVVADDPGAVAQFLRACSRSRQLVPGSLTLVGADGYKVACRAEGAIFRPYSGNGPALVLVRLTPKEAAASRFLLLNQKIEELSKEVHRRQQAQRRLEESETRFRQLAENITAVFWLADQRQPAMLYVSPAYEVVWGRPCQSLYDDPRSFLDAVHPDDRERVLDAMRRQHRGETTAEEYRVVRPDGSVRWVFDQGFPVRDATGQLVSVAGIAEDVTERKQMEEALRDSEQRFARCMQHLPGLAWIKDAEGRYVYTNDAAERAFRTPRAQLYGKTDEEIFPSETAAQFRENDRRALASEAGIQTVETLEHDDGVLHHSLVSKFPIPGSDGQAAFVGGMAIDVTDRVRAEEQLRHSERNLADFFENAAMGLHWVGPDGIILRANQAELDLLGYSREEYVGCHIAEFHADQEVIADILRRLQAGEELRDYEARLRCKDGSLRHVLINSNVLWEDGRFIHTRCFTRDVTEQKRAEALLRERVQEIETLMEVVPIAIFKAHDPECRSITGNPAACNLLRTPKGLNLSKTAPGEERPTHFRVYRNGQEVPAPELPIQLAAAQGVEMVGEELDVVFDDGEVKHVYACASPLLDERGQARGCLAAMLDITERKRLEREVQRRLEELAEADRRKDEFLAMLAHELRNPLAPIRNALQILRLAANDRAALQQARTMMERQVQQMVRLIDDLLDVSRITRNKLELRKEWVELAAVVQSAVETTRPLVEAASHQLAVALPPEPVLLDADPVRLAQVFSNLLNNAAKYTEGGGQIWLTAAREGSDAVVRVRDTGLGIPSDMLGRIFEMFTQVDGSLERKQGGLGIGLTLVQRLVEMHGGSVEARSEGPGKGSEFIVRLPVLAMPRIGESQQANGGGEQTPLTCRQRILVVDDNRDSADSLALMLRIMGHDIRTAHDGLEAVEAAGQLRPDVILLDIGMPRLNGYDAARRIREQPGGKGILLVAMTGWGQEEDKRRAAEAGFDHHLTKPVDPGALERLLIDLPRPVH